MNISLPEGLKSFVEKQVTEQGYGTTSEYVRELIRREQQRDTLRSALLRGAASPPAAVADAAYFQGLREDVLGSAGE